MRRFILYVAATTILVSLLATTVAVTTHEVSAPPCPWCGATHTTTGTRFDTSTLYTCKSCSQAFYGPPRSDFSWAETFEEWLDDTPMVE